MNFLLLAISLNQPLATEWESPGIIFFKLTAILALVLANGFFVASEFALVKIRTSQLDTLIDKGNRRASFSRHVVEHLDAYLSATQLGITLASLGLGMLGEPFLAHMIQPFFYKLGVTSEFIIRTTSIIMAFSLITYLHIVLGELAPKSLAIRKALPVTLWVSRPLDWFYVLLKPFIWFLNGNANLLLRHVLKIEPVGESELAHSEEELRVILSDSEKGNQVSKLGKEILINALDLKHRVARDIMTPRGEVIYLDLEEPFDTQVQLAIDSKHARFPLCKAHLDEALGLIHIKDLLALVHGGKPDLFSIKRELPHVSEMMPLEKLLRLFLSKRAHFAVAVDEYGGAVGIVTLDNVLEEIVGSIQDEFDTAENDVNQISPEEFDVEGALALYELNDMIDAELESTDVSTIGGYITAQLGHIPVRGEHIRIDKYTVTVTNSDGRRVLRVHFKKKPEPIKSVEEK